MSVGCMNFELVQKSETSNPRVSAYILNERPKDGTKLINADIILHSSEKSRGKLVARN